MVVEVVLNPWDFLGLLPESIAPKPSTQKLKLGAIHLIGHIGKHSQTRPGPTTGGGGLGH